MSSTPHPARLGGAWSALKGPSAEERGCLCGECAARVSTRASWRVILSCKPWFWPRRRPAPSRPHPDLGLGTAGEPPGWQASGELTRIPSSITSSWSAILREPPPRTGTRRTRRSGRRRSLLLLLSSPFHGLRDPRNGAPQPCLGEARARSLGRRRRNGAGGGGGVSLGPALSRICPIATRPETWPRPRPSAGKLPGR